MEGNFISKNCQKCQLFCGHFSKHWQIFQVYVCARVSHNSFQGKCVPMFVLKLFLVWFTSGQINIQNVSNISFLLLLWRACIQNSNSWIYSIRRFFSFISYTYLPYKKWMLRRAFIIRPMLPKKCFFSVAIFRLCHFSSKKKNFFYHSPQKNLPTKKNRLYKIKSVYTTHTHTHTKMILSSQFWLSFHWLYIRVFTLCVCALCVCCFDILYEFIRKPFSKKKPNHVFY